MYRQLNKKAIYVITSNEIGGYRLTVNGARCAAEINQIENQEANC